METKAAILYETGKPLVVETLRIPKLKDGQVLVKILYSGVCRSQLNEIKGLKGEDRFLPHLLGHEGSGIVADIGAGVTKVKKGDYVVLSWMKGNGMDVVSCQYSNGDAKINSGAITTFSEYSVISENRVFRISKEVAPEIAALLGCAVPTGAGIVKNTIGLKKENTIAIFGIGGIGSSALLYAGSLGCVKIIAIDVSDFKLDFAKEIGATDKINPNEEDVILRIQEITEGRGVDYAIESSGIKEVMELAFASIKNQGTAIIAGNLKFGEKISIDPFDLIKGKKILETWGGETHPERDIPIYVDLYISGKLKLDCLCTQIYRLADINRALEDLDNGKVGRALINMCMAQSGEG